MLYVALEELHESYTRNHFPPYISHFGHIECPSILLRKHIHYTIDLILEENEVCIM